MAQATQGLGLYEPINTLKPVADGVWIVDGPVISFPYPGLGFLGIRVPFTTRMTIIRLVDGGLWIHSPTELAPALKSQIDALGPVRHLIAPNRLHYWWVGEWKRAYPESVTWASPGVRERAQPQGIAFDRDLTQAPDSAWEGEMDQLLVRGSYLTEVVFFHRASRTLVLTDLIQSFEPDKVLSPTFRFLVRMSGCADPDGSTPIDLRSTFFLHRAKVRSAVERMIAWQPERVILAHGRWYPENGVAELKRALRWTGAGRG